MQIFGYFHRSRLLPIIKNSERVKLILGIPYLCTYLISRLLKFKNKIWKYISWKIKCIW